MLIIGCDFHTRYQQIAMANDETGELLLDRRLDHESGEAHTFLPEIVGTVAGQLHLLCFHSRCGNFDARLPPTLQSAAFNFSLDKQ
jgi:hypothetical protein